MSAIINQHNQPDHSSSGALPAADPLLECLLFVARQNDRHFTPKELTSGLPLKDNRLTPRVFVRAAERAGFASHIKKLPLKKILFDRLPAIVLLENNRPVLALELDRNTNQLECLVPGSGVQQMPVEEIQRAYTGYALELKLQPHFDARLEAVKKSTARNWFWRVIKKSSAIYRDVLLASFMINVFALASPLFIMNVYDRVVPNHALVTLWVLVIGVLIVFAFDLLLRSLRGYFIDIAGKRSDIELSARIYEKVLNVNMASRPSSVGAFSSHLDEFENVRNFITSATVSTLVDLPFIILFLLVIWFVAGNLVLVPLIAMPIIMLYALLMQIPIKRAVEKSQLGAAQKNATLMESLIGIETVKVLGAESQLQHKLEDAAEYVSEWRVRSRMLSTSVVNLAVFVQQMVTIAVVAYGVYLIAEQSLSLGALIASVILAGRIMAPMGQIANLATHYHQTRNALNTLDKIMALPGERDSSRSYLHMPAIKGDIEFEKVSFSYPGEKKPALDDVSLHIHQGEHVGIIGRTGSGKTTMEKLMLSLYQPTQGYIRVDGIDLQQIDPAELRAHVGYVPQDIMLFYGSIRDNLVFGDPLVSDESLLKAVHNAGITQLVKQHPLGFDMPIGERGSGLSGGQRQSVAIARALLRDPEVIIMDEPSNAMDNRTEAELRQRLQKIIVNKTFVLITHKSTMLDLVDRLIVIDAGKIIADGRKHEVLDALKSGQVHG